jgi:hypothetical protein
MAETYNNVPMTEEEAKLVAERDARWTGPRLIALTAGALGIALLILWSAAWRKIGPSFDGEVPLIHYTDTTAPSR